MSLKLFFVRADSADGDNLDLLVNATDAHDAKALWHAHFNEAGEDEYPVDHIEWVGEVPVIATRGAIAWDRIRGC